VLGALCEFVFVDVPFFNEARSTFVLTKHSLRTCFVLGGGIQGSFEIGSTPTLARFQVIPLCPFVPGINEDERCVPVGKCILNHLAKPPGILLRR
jgi:hypothetical protein